MCNKYGNEKNMKMLPPYQRLYPNSFKLQKLWCSKKAIIFNIYIVDNV